MSKTILTNAFSAYKAQCEATNQPIIMDEFVFALVPDQDPDAPISANETLPADAHIKGRFSVTKKGMINPDAVVYSIILGTEVGTWDFNWIGLVNSNTNIVGAITHTKIQTKEQADPENNTEGDTLARNIITSYLNASNLTQITVTAEVWQLDFNNRLTAIDERIRIDNMDMYGHASFIQDGWKATSNNGAVSLTAGVAYIAGLRCVNIDAMPINLNGIILPKTIYLEACFMGGINSAWQTTTNIVIADSHPPTRIENGITYYSNPIAIITSIDNITDLRPIDWRTAHLNVGFDPHKQYLLRAEAATNEDIGRKSMDKKFIELPQFWLGLKKSTETINAPSLNHKTFKVVGDSSKFTLVAFPLSLGANDKIQIWREGTDSIGGTDPNWNDGDATYFGEMSLDIDASGTRNCLVNAYQSRLIIGGINTKHATPKQAEVFLRASPNGATYHYRYLTRAINPDVVIMTSAVLPSAHRPYDKTGAVSINVYGSFHEGMDRVYSPKNKPTPDAIGALTEAEANTLYLKKAVETILYNDSRKLLQNNALLQLDASLYDEIRFHSQWTVNSEGQMPYLSVSTIPVVDILEAVTRSGINSLFDMKTATSGAFYAACSVIYVANSKSLQFQTSGKYYQHVGVFKVVGIKR